MLQAMWRPEARMEVADVHVEVGDFDWPHPVETHTCEQKPQLSLSLTPPPPHSQVRYESGGGQDRYANVGDLIFFPGAVPFSGRSDGGRQRLLTCRFGSERFAQLRHSDSPWNETELNNSRDVRDARIRSALARIAQETVSPGLAGSILVESLLTVVLVDLARYLERSKAADKPCRGGLAPWQMRRVKERVDNCDEPSPTVTELARLCGVSTRHLMRGFKQASGTTLHRYVEAVRLNRAKALLLQTGLPLKAISWQLGFAHPSNFSSAFTRALGLTPTQFRAQCGARTS